MTIYYIDYYVKVATKGGGRSKTPKFLTTWFMDDPCSNKVKMSAFDQIKTFF